MLSVRHTLAASLAALIVSAGGFAGPSAAAPLGAAPDPAAPAGHAIPVRRGGGFSLYIGPDYGYDYGYRDYYDDDYYDDYPRRRYYRYYDGYDGPYRKHSRRWVRERFQHPLGRR